MQYIDENLTDGLNTILNNLLPEELVRLNSRRKENIMDENLKSVVNCNLENEMNESRLLVSNKMASNTTGGLCPLCFGFSAELMNYEEMNIKIEKYLQIKMEYSSTNICLNCYNSIYEFHIFYERVHSAQKNFSEKYSVPIQKKTEIICKTETEKEAGINKFQCQDTSDITDNLDQKENAGESKSVANVNSYENECSTKTEKRQKLKHSKFKEISNEMERKMIEFYNVKCEKCEVAQFTSFKMLNKHYVTVHNTQGYIKCCKRNIRVNDKYYLRSHMFKHLLPDTCRCKVCGKELSSLATLKHHMILHKPTEERPFQCCKCEKRFCCKNDLKNHEKAIHLPESEREDYICDVCGKVFQKVANLKYHHSTVHLQERKYICEICAKCFTTHSGLRTHINAAHSTLNPIQCHGCNKWLKTKDTFQKHLQLHQNNTYPCTHCNKVCNSSASLRSHLVKHSEERPYSCTICKKSFKTKTHLKNHSSQHLGGSSYKCPYCSKLFVNMSNYYTHRRRMHSGERADNKQDNKTEEIMKPGREPPDQGIMQKNNYVPHNKIVQNNSENFNSPLVSEDVPTVKSNIIMSNISVKYL